MEVITGIWEQLEAHKRFLLLKLVREEEHQRLLARILSNERVPELHTPAPPTHTPASLFSATAAATATVTMK